VHQLQVAPERACVLVCVVTSQVLCVSSVDTEGAVSVSAKISDFGLALRAMPLPNGRGWASVSNPPRGTPLYMAPELLKETDARGCVQVWSAAGFFCALLSGMYVHHLCICALALISPCPPLPRFRAPCTGFAIVGCVQLWCSTGVFVHWKAQSYRTTRCAGVVATSHLAFADTLLLRLCLSLLSGCLYRAFHQ
jgi:serine/threonine protein kinase